MLNVKCCASFYFFSFICGKGKPIFMDFVRVQEYAGAPPSVACNETLTEPDELKLTVGFWKVNVDGLT